MAISSFALHPCFEAVSRHVLPYPIGSMGLVYLPTYFFYGKYIGKYTIYIYGLFGALCLILIPAPKYTTSMFFGGVFLGAKSQRCQTLGIQSYSQLMIGMSNHILSRVLGFQYHSQKVIGSLGKPPAGNLCACFLSGVWGVLQNKGKSKGWEQKEEDTAAPTPYL